MASSPATGITKSAHVRLFAIVLAVVLIHAMSASSYSAETVQQKAKDDIPLLSEEAQDVLDEQQKEISDKLISTAEWIDSFFEDERYLAEGNTTRATFKLDFGYTKNDDFDFKPRLSLRMRFPNLTKRFNLLIQAAEDQDFEADANPSQPSDEETGRDQLEAALQYVFIDSLRQNFSTTFGGSYNYLYGGLRYRYQKRWEKWLLRFTDRVRWYTDDGWENVTSLDFERKISSRMMFRAITSASWQEDEDGIPHSEILRVYQVLSEEQAILYEGGVYLNTEPEYDVVDIQLKVRYRQRFYRDWLVFEIAPQITFPEDHDYEANPGIFFKLEASFGYNSNSDVFGKIFNF